MSGTFQRLFHVRENESRTFLVLALLNLANTAARQMAGIVGITSVVNVGGLGELLLVNALNGVLLMITAVWSSLIVDRYGRQDLLRWTSIALGSGFVLLAVVQWLDAPPKLTAALVYLISQQQLLVFPMFFWLLVNDALEVAAAQRLIPVIGSWGFLGNVVGIGAGIVPGILSAIGLSGQSSLTLNSVIATNIGIYVGITTLMTLGLRHLSLRRTRPTDQTAREQLAEGWTFVREVSAFKFLQLAILMLAVCDVIIDLRFLVVAKDAIPDPAAYQQFYSLYVLVAAIAGFALQGFLSHIIKQRLGLKNSFFVQPFIAFGASVAMLVATSSLAINTVTSELLKIARITVGTSSGKELQGLIPEERRGRVSLVLNDYTPAAGCIVGTALTAALAYGGFILGTPLYVQGYLGVSVLAGIGAIVATMVMHARYEESFLNWRLRRRTRAASVLSKLDL